MLKWFFSEILARSSKAVPYLWPYSIPTWAKTAGMILVLSFLQWTIGPQATTWLPRLRFRLGLFAPISRHRLTFLLQLPSQHQFLRLDCHYGYSQAVAPVAQALETLNTGIPVCPICFVIAGRYLHLRS